MVVAGVSGSGKDDLDPRADRARLPPLQRRRDADRSRHLRADRLPTRLPRRRRYAVAADAPSPRPPDWDFEAAPADTSFRPAGRRGAARSVPCSSRRSSLMQRPRSRLSRWPRRPRVCCRSVRASCSRRRSPCGLLPESSSGHLLRFGRGRARTNARSSGRADQARPWMIGGRTARRTGCCSRRWAQRCHPSNLRIFGASIGVYARRGGAAEHNAAPCAVGRTGARRNAGRHHRSGNLRRTGQATSAVVRYSGRCGSC